MPWDSGIQQRGGTIYHNGPNDAVYTIVLIVVPE